MESLARDKEKWYENQVRRKEQMEILRQQISDANADINQTNKSLENLAKMEQEYQKDELRQPRLENYYTP